MDRSADRRMRAKAQFRSELPLPVRQAELDPTKLSEVAGLLGPIHICPALVEKRLLEIATQYRSLDSLRGFRSQTKSRLFRLQRY
jgi:hypothetical protein